LRFDPSHSHSHPRKNIRWRYPDRFPYRVIYEVDETRQTVIVAAILHAARHDEHWQSRQRFLKMHLVSKCSA
jgi:plasmid stabilization system protein ParE